MGWVTELDEAVASGDEKRLAEVAYVIESEIMLHSEFPEVLLCHLLDVINCQSFLGMQGSWVLLRIFEYEAESMSEDQRMRTASVLETVYPRFKDWMGQFVISEVLSDLVCSSYALSVWERLSQVNDVTARSFVPHGLEHVIESADDPKTKQSALQLLLKQQEDCCANVRNEAYTSLQRLVNKGIVDQHEQTYRLS